MFLPPVLHGPLRELYWRVRHGKSWSSTQVGFEGWGLKTVHYPPWADAGLPGAELEERFLAAHQEMKKAVASGEVRLTQFGAEADAAVDSLMWRHYVVFWSAALASRTGEKNMAECGVCDGLTAFFALRAAGATKAYLYDAWAPMKDDALLSSEKTLAGSYAYLDVENTRRNLARFEGRTVWNKGFIPNVFTGADNPNALSWLHVDLNSAKPTLSALEFFYDRLAPGGVILVDDYAWKGYEDTRIAVRRWSADKAGTMLPLPTGQALFLKS
jgi:O-methyltransferase